MVLTIKNFESQSVWPWVTETAPTNLVGVAGTLKATLTWTSATWESWVIWSEEKLVRKEWSAPSNSLDWTTVATITTKDTYSSTGYEDKWLSSETTYYYGVFAVYDNGTERGVTTSVTTNVMTTATIKWNEVSNPEDFFLEYADDADGWVQGSTEFDKFFGYSAVRLNASWVETAEVTQEQSWWPGKLDFSQLWNLTTWDNVMIKFPIRWIKMEKSWSTVTLSITKELNKAWYQYYAFNRNWTIQDAMYLGAYKATGSSSKLTSLSNASPVTNITIDNARTGAMANGTNYQQETIWQRWYINALYMMKYGNPNNQSVVWQWYTWWRAKQNTGATNSQADATYGTTSTTGRVKLFWLEDWRGNISEWTDWLRSTSSRVLLADTSNDATSIATRPSSAGWNWIATWVSYSSNTHWNIISVVWTNEWMFTQTWMSWIDYTKYYADYGDVLGSRVAYAGGGWGSGSGGGAFHLIVSNFASGSDSGIGARLMYL